MLLKIKTDDNGFVHVRDEVSGVQLGCIQKLTYTVEVDEDQTKAVLEIANISLDVSGVQAEVVPVMFGQHMKRLENMSQEEIVEALKWEAKQRYLLKLQMVESHPRDGK
jgi:hypothetical protein